MIKELDYRLSMITVQLFSPNLTARSRKNLKPSHGLDFSDAIFKNRVDFIGATFRDEVIFRNAKFHGETNFGGSNFKKAIFAYSRFTKAKFIAATFNDNVEFYGTIFAGLADFTGINVITCASFRNVVFGGVTRFSEAHLGKEADFSLAQFETPEDVTFQKCDLSKVKFKNCDLRQIRFSMVKWNRQHRFFSVPRNKVYDEILAKPEDLEAVAELYRDLQINFVNSYRYSQAGDFYIGEQEMIRKRRALFWRVLSFRSLYFVASRYGESALRPICWLVFVLILCSGILFMNGIYLETGHPSAPKSEYIDYNLDLESGQLSRLQKDFWRVFAHNIALASFYRTGPAAPRMGSWQQILIIIETITIVSLITLFLLALKRRFRRKSF
ncbi:pentapeptide repeat-containing protein [Candidatus Zixiibacteriota bacterium]